MAVNSDKPTRWKKDIAKSVDLYNEWFIAFAPKAFRDTRAGTTKRVEDALKLSSHLKGLSPVLLKENPAILPMLRMATAPPIARDRLIGLAQVPPNLVHCMEGTTACIPARMPAAEVDSALNKMVELILKLADRDIFTWLDSSHAPSEVDEHRAATIVADRLCGAVADPIVRNAQEKRQLGLIRKWLEAKGYREETSTESRRFQDLKSGTFAFRLNVPVKLESGEKKVNIPIDVVVMPKKARAGGLPLLINQVSRNTQHEQASKEEAVKMSQLRSTYGKATRFILFLCGYFDSGYLGYDAAEGIDWVWEHRIGDLASFGL